MNAEETELQFIPLGSIAPSATNPRKTFDDEALGQLAESIRSKGVLEPILVRPKTVTVNRGPTKGQHAGYELIAGERRWRAAQRAELKVIPALVRSLNDKEAAEVQVIENDQREDVPPLEQARGYQRLLDMGDDVQSIATKIGRPAKYVFARLQLTKLIKGLRDDLEIRKIGFGHAHLLARLPEKDQHDIQDDELYDWEGNVMSVEELRRFLRQGYVHDLTDATWKLDDADLVPEAGACTTCPKRRGHNPHLFEELLNGEGKAKKKADYCLDGACFHGKAAALIQVGVETVKQQTGVEPVRITTDFYGPRNGDDKPVLTCDQYEIVKGKEAVAALDVKPAVIVGGDGVGKLVQVRVKKQAAAKKETNPYAREQAKQREKADIGKRAIGVAAGMVATKTADATCALSPQLMKMLRAIVSHLAYRGFSDACRLIAKRRKLNVEAQNHTTKIAELADEMDTGAELLGLLAEIIAADKANYSWTHNSGPDDARSKAFWATWGVDRAKLLKQAAEESADAKPAKKAKGKKRAKAIA